MITHFTHVPAFVWTDINAQTQQVMHRAAHAAGRSCVERRVGFLVLTVDLCSAGHQQLHHLQVAWKRGDGEEMKLGASTA